MKKSRLERIYPFRRGNFDVIGFIIKIALTAAIIALFVVFFDKFADMYLSLETNWQLDIPTRSFELLTMLYGAVIVFMVVSGISQISREIFGADDVKMFSAMPVGSGALFGSKLISIYLGQFIVSIAITLSINLTLGIRILAGWQFYVVTAVICLLLPLITIAISSLLVIPYYRLKLLLKDRFVINFIIVSALLGVMFYLYAIVLDAIKQLLLGGSLKYFFDDKVMATIATMCKYLYPSRWIAGALMSAFETESWLGLILVTAACITLALVMIRLVLMRAMQSRNEGSDRSIRKHSGVSKGNNVFVALLKKEFLHIFRTPSYMFSCFSVAIIMPLMVYFCMTVASSLVQNLVGLEFNLELAVFLTILFGSLTNIFCATNISRDGYMFYVVKGFPISSKTVFLSKVVLCAIVTALSQLTSAILVSAMGYIPWYSGIFLFVVGMLFGLANILVATRYDFDHANFSTEDDGEIKESSNAVSVIILIGLVMSFTVGGAIFAFKAITQLRGANLEYMTYLLAGGLAVLFAALASVYMILGLKRKYYEFEGGNI